MRIDPALLTAIGVATAIAVAPTAGAEPTPVPVPPDPTPVAAPSNPVAAETDPNAGVPHLPSPDYLPPGTAPEPTVPEGRGVSYLRDLWHAVQTQEVSGADALLLLTQRPMRADSAPPGGLPAGPQSLPPAPQAAPLPDTATGASAPS